MDDDCDQLTDEDVTRSCYTGPANTEDVGICRGGTQTCSGGSFGACVGEQTPMSQENCANATDDDCDGTCNDGCHQPVFQLITTDNHDRVYVPTREAADGWNADPYWRYEILPVVSIFHTRRTGGLNTVELFQCNTGGGDPFFYISESANCDGGLLNHSLGFLARSEGAACSDLQIWPMWNPQTSQMVVATTDYWYGQFGGMGFFKMANAPYHAWTYP